MATGKKAKDIFTPTITKPEGISLEVRRRTLPEPYEKTTLCLFNRQALLLAKVELAIRERFGDRVSRSELVRALIEDAADRINPDNPDFEKEIRDLFPEGRR